jgi:methylmalonyl-CoA mutase N-terminal domain/subunit
MHFHPLSRRIGDLKRERAELEEEVLQLRAAVQIWTEVCRQTRSHAAGSEALDAEMR